MEASLSIRNPSRLEDFQRNVGFVVIVILGGVAIFVYLATSLVDVLVPLVWAAFFAVPLTGLIAKIDTCITTELGNVRWWWRGYEVDEPEQGVEFTAQVGENHISVKHGAAAKALLQKLEHPCKLLCFLPSSRCCQSRVRITKLNRGACALAGEPVNEPEVNRFVVKWLYYIKERDPASESAKDEVQLELFLDQEFTCPAVVGGTMQGDSRLAGTLELDRRSVLSWSFAVLIALVSLTVAVYIFLLATALGLDAFQANASSYARGLEEIVEYFNTHLKSLMPAAELENLNTRVLELARSGLPDAATSMASYMEAVGFQVLLFLLYTMFWIFEPIPMNSNVAEVIKNYLLLKTVVCLVFAVCMSVLLYLLSCPLWHIFFVVSFLFNYIPEIGFMVVFVLALLAILLDAHVGIKERQANAFIFLLGGLLIKVVTANILEVHMYVSKGGQYMRMHPVIIMAMMMFFERLLGLSGMFLAIPMAAAIKYYVLSADVPSVYLNPTLSILEGDDVAPHRNFVERYHASYGGTENKV